jgi:hypothetical protein
MVSIQSCMSMDADLRHDYRNDREVRRQAVTSGELASPDSSVVSLWPALKDRIEVLGLGLVGIVLGFGVDDIVLGLASCPWP